LKTTALLDSNILIAAVAEAHEHHAASLDLLLGDVVEFAVAAHSYAEAFSTLTRQGKLGPFRFSPGEAWAALESVRAVTALVGLTPAQIFAATRDYAHGGGIGARLFDKLIGEAAVVHGIPAIITWNTTHVRNLFPMLTVSTPGEFSREALTRRP
jgi:predicted nucleic acid-binding protein